MKLEKLPSGSYRLQKQINGKRYSFTWDHKPTQKEINETIAEKTLTPVTSKNAPKRTFKECSDKYFDVKKNILSASTYRTDLSRADNLSEEFKNTLMCELDNLTVQKEINRLSEKLAPKTVKNYYSVISNVLEMFMPDLKLSVTVPKRAPKKEIYVPTPEEVKRVLEASNEKYWIMFMLAAYGLRRSEAVALVYPDDFDLKNNIIYINKAKVKGVNGWVIQNYNKTDESTRSLPVSQELIDAIQKQGYVFEGKPDKILEYLHTKQKQLGIEQFRLHDFRHYFATELDQAGISSKDLQKLGGWSSDLILRKVYQHNRVEKDRKIQKKAADAIAKTLS